MAVFNELPNEIILAIIDVSVLPAVAALSRTNKRFWGLASFEVFRHDAASENPKALIWAARNGRTGALERSLDAGTSPDVKPTATDGQFNYPLSLTVKYGYDKLTRVLLERGATVDIPCYGLCECTFFAATSRWTPVHLAICSKSFSAAELLIAYNAYTADLGPIWSSIIHTASATGASSLLEELVHPDNVNIPDGGGFTPLHYTYLCFDPVIEKTTSCLAMSGANLNSGMRPGLLPPLQLACGNNYRVATSLLNAGAEFETAWLNKCVASIKTRSEGGWIPDERREEFEGLQESFIRAVVDRGCPVDSQSALNDTPLIHAIDDGDLFIVNLLIELGANIDVQGENGTPLMRAVKGRKMSYVESLLAQGANIHLKGRYGCSVLSHIQPRDVSEDNRGILDVLLNAGASIENHEHHPDHGFRISYLELAVYEAPRGNGLAFQSIERYSGRLANGIIVLEALDYATNKPAHMASYFADFLSKTR